MSAPKGRTGLYRIRGEEDLLLYIGITNGMAVRWNSHMRVQPWWDELRSLTLEWYDTRAEAEDAEEAAVKAELPKYNKTYLVPRKPRFAASVPARPAVTEPPVSEILYRAEPIAAPELAGFLGITLPELRELVIQETEAGYRAADVYAYLSANRWGDGPDGKPVKMPWPEYPGAA